MAIANSVMLLQAQILKPGYAASMVDRPRLYQRLNA